MGRVSHWEPSTGASDEWYTPAYVFAALDVAFDMDVAHPPYPMETHVPARIKLHSDSLSQDWYGFVWMNPPFGGRNSLAPWLKKFFDHGNGIALVPDRTSAPWFHDAWARADLVMFTPKIRFIRPDGSEGKSPSNGTALMAVGLQGVAGMERAARVGLGILARPESVEA